MANGKKKGNQGKGERRRSVPPAGKAGQRRRTAGSGPTRAELMAQAKQGGIAGRSRMTREQLQAALALLEAVMPREGILQPPGEAGGPAVSRPLPPQGVVSAPAGGVPSLPASYGAARAVLLPRDPRTAFGYWEVPEEELERVRRRVGEGTLAVRLFSSEGGREMVIISGSDGRRVGSWYFHLPRPEMEVHFEVGWLARGEFHLLLSSNPVRLPREAPPPEGEGELSWMRWSPAKAEIFRLSGGGQIPGSSPGFWSFMMERIHLPPVTLFSRPARKPEEE